MTRPQGEGLGGWAPNQLERESLIHADAVRKARRTCADAAARGAFPKEELLACLDMLGIREEPS